MRDDERIPHPEHFPRVTNRMWRDGLSYAEVQAAKYARTLPVGADRDGIMGAARKAVVEAALNYNGSDSQWITYVHRSVNSRIWREARAGYNWLRQIKCGSRTDVDRPAAYSLQQIVGRSEERLEDLVGADETYNPEWIIAGDPTGLWRALSSLSARERELIRLRFFDGLTQDEIGRHYGRSQTWVGDHLHRVLAELKRLVSEMT